MGLSDKPVSRTREPKPLDRSVRPNRRTYTPLPVIAILGDNFLAESGETGTVTQLVDEIPKREATLFTTVGAADFVAMLDETYAPLYPGTWQIITAPRGENSIVRVEQFEHASRVTVVINQFGWKKKTGGNYHRIIDPIAMHGKTLDEIRRDNHPDPIRRLLAWAIELRDFCAEHNLQVRPTVGAISSQMLKHPEIYPHARRKVSAKVNERARENLPGNHYFLNVEPDESNDFSAYYLDQRRAHHYHARLVHLPDSDHCFAYGDFKNLSTVAFRSVDPDFMGLYCLNLRAPANRPIYDWVGSELDGVFVYSNEVPYLLDSGYRIRGVLAAWGSVQRDTGISHYARWAEAQLDRYGDPVWLKILLHATYGCLATRPMTRKTIYRLAKRGEPVTIRTGRRKLTGLMVESTRKMEPGIAHVIQRGMIEAATRIESIGLAQWLAHQGHNILSIYADGVIVEANDDNPLPLLPEPWSHKTHLTHLRYYTPQAFESLQMTKLPGVSADIRDRRFVQVGSARRVITGRPVGEK